MHYQKLITNLLALILTANFSCVDENKPSPFKFLFAQATTDQPFTVEAEMMDGKKPKRWQGKMVVEGVVTDAIWPEYPPPIYKINDRFYVIEDRHTGSPNHVWDRQTKTLSAIGRGHFKNAHGLGFVGFRQDLESKPRVVEIFDFVAKTGKPRVRYIASTNFSSLNLIGVWQDGILLTKSKNSVASIRCGIPVRELTFDLKGYSFAYGSNGIRGNRVLLTKTSPNPSDSGAFKPYEVHAAILDLTTGCIKPIGQFKGGWTNHSAVAHSSYQLKWITPQEAKKEPLAAEKFYIEHFLGGSLGRVVEGTETLLK